MFVSPPVKIGPVVHCASVTVTPVRVIFPVFVKVKVNVTVLPLAIVCVAGVLVKTMEGEDGSVVVLVSGSVTFGPVGGVPVTVAVLAREPALMSACVKV